MKRLASCRWVYGCHANVITLQVTFTIVPLRSWHQPPCSRARQLAVTNSLGVSRRVCDADVGEIGTCQTAVANPKNRGIWSIGAVGRCLSRQLAENKPLTLDCRSLVIVAAPKVRTSSSCRFWHHSLSWD